MRVYIVWVKGKKVTLKNPPGRGSRGYLAGRPYPWNTCKIDNLARLFIFQSCASHMPFSREPLSRTSRELVTKCPDLHLSLSLHQLNTKPNTIKSHKIQEIKLKQLQHFLSWNKVNIKYSCKSQLYDNKRRVHPFDATKTHFLLLLHIVDIIWFEHDMSLYNNNFIVISWW